jgi:hypothetical protein
MDLIGATKPSPTRHRTLYCILYLPLAQLELISLHETVAATDGAGKTRDENEP